ncbi:MAG: hypothetical protein CMF43_01130 [Legionellales bacterium]|nr:hypothetical protein [Legionellales bacterium]
MPKYPSKSDCLNLKEFLIQSRLSISNDTLRRSKSTNDVQEIVAQRTWSGYLSEASRSVWQYLLCLQPLIEATSHVIATMAYFSLTLSITYSAVINLALLQMPFWLYASMLVLIALTEFVANIVDWYMKHYHKSERFSDQKILSIERRFLLHPDLKSYASTQGSQKALEQLAAYLFLERAVREEIQHTISHTNHSESSAILQRYDQYPIELQCRLALAMCPNKAPMKTNESELSDIYKKLKNMTDKSIQYLRNNEGKDFVRLKAVICLKNGLQNVSIQDRIALETTSRFASFAMQYIDALNPHMSDTQKNKIFKWQLNKYLDKRSKKELNLLTVSQSLTGFFAKVIVWGSTISRGLLVVANAPIKLISQLMHANMNPLSCVWFFFSGWFTGVSSENTKKCLIKINRSSWSGFCIKLKAQLCDPQSYIRFMIMAAASISSCYFSAFSFRRLLDDPESIGAIYLMKLLAQIIAPMILPMLSHFWWVFTALSTMINLYVDCKFYASDNNAVKETTGPGRNQDIAMQKKQNNWIQSLSNGIIKHLPKTLMAGFRIMSAVAVSALTYVSISGVGTSRLWAMLLSSGTILMRYAKLSNLQIKIQEVYSQPESALSMIQPLNWHSDAIDSTTNSSTDPTIDEIKVLRGEMGRRDSWPF